MRKQDSRNERRGQKYDSNDDEEMYKHKREYSTKSKLNQKMHKEHKQRGERFTKKEKKQSRFKNKNNQYRGETNKWGDDDDDDDDNDNDYNYYHFDEEVHFAERHFNDESGKNRYEKHEKRRFSKTENDKKFVIQADLNQFY